MARRCLLFAVCLSVWPTSLGGPRAVRAQAFDIIRDDFSQGIDPQIYQPLGSAVLTLDSSNPLDPKVRVSVFNTGDGLQITIPQDLSGDPSAMCLRIFQDIDHTTFPQGFAWRHSIEMENLSLGIFAGSVDLTANRSFWNRCRYKLDWNGNVVQTGFLWPAEGANVKWECPGPKDVAFDWLPPEQPGGPERIQIEVLSDVGDCKFKTTKPSPIQHDPGGGVPPPPNAYRITKWKITAVEESKETNCEV